MRPARRKIVERREWSIDGTNRGTNSKMQRRLALLCLAGLLACDRDSERPTPEPSPVPAASDAKAEAQTPAPPSSAPVSAKAEDATEKPHEVGRIPHARPKPNQEQIDAAKTRATGFQGHLDAGRKASKAKNFDEAFTQLTKARELRPHDPSVLGELGYASYKAGKLDDAQRWTEDAISRTENPRKLGALFYNLGLIAEARGDGASAKLHYETSLGHRDNATVESKLEALSDLTPPKGHDTLEAYCALELRRLECEPEGEIAEDAPEPEELEGEHWCGCEVKERIESTTPDGSIREAAIVNVGWEDVGYVIEIESVLLVRTAEGGWQEAHSVLNSWMKEFCDSDTDEGAIASIEFRDVSPAPGHELVATWRHYFNDMPELDSEQNTQVDTNDHGTVLCGGEVPACARWQTHREITKGEFHQWEVKDPKTTTTRLSESFDPAQGLTLAIETGKAEHESWKGIVGTFSFDELFSKRAFRPQRLR